MEEKKRFGWITERKNSIKGVIMQDIRQQAVNAVRVLSAEAIEKRNRAIPACLWARRPSVTPSLRT